MSNNATTRGGIINSSSRKWPNNKVFYRFHSSVPDRIKTYIEDAIYYWEGRSAVSFQNYDLASNNDYIYFKCGNDGSYSYLGKIGGAQDLFIDLSVTSKGTPMHEIGHALGLIHEQCRNDRDNYITINTSNIKPDWISQYNKETASHNKSASFDFNSIMLYGSWVSGSMVYNTNIPAMTKKDGSTWNSQRSYLSEQDVRMVATIYGQPTLEIPVVIETSLSGIVTSPGQGSSRSPLTSLSVKLDRDIVLTAVPDEGRRLEGWYYNGTKVSTSNPYNHHVIYTPELEIKVKFETTDGTYKVVARMPSVRGISSAGTITGSGTYNVGDLCTVTFVPNPASDKTFAGWIDCSHTPLYADYSQTAPILSQQYSYAFIVTKDTIIEAKFE